MIDNKNLLQLLRTELPKMNKGDKIKFLTYKKDRSILVEKGGDTFTVVENGYRQIVWENLTEIEVLKRMKKLQKIEFPRSNKLYLSKQKWQIVKGYNLSFLLIFYLILISPSCVEAVNTLVLFLFCVKVSLDESPLTLMSPSSTLRL